MYALILAGGSGTRLWPYSRSDKPKQFLALSPRADGAEPRSLLQETVDRILPLIPPSNVYVATGSVYAQIVAEQLPDVPAENIIVEPSGRGTAPCIGLGALHMLRRDHNAVMAVLSSDHIVQHADRLRNALITAEEGAGRGLLVTIGIHPTAPTTGYGYIEKGDFLFDHEGTQVYKVQRFVEKPDAPTARGYFASGHYFWNAGMFVWRADVILKELDTHCPGVAAPLKPIGAAIGTSAEETTLLRHWVDMESIAIDVGVMERTEHAAVIPADLAWSDVGDWAALADFLPHDADGNAIVGKATLLDTHDTLVFGAERMIATIGLQDLMIIDTPDALLVCPRSRAQDVKAMVMRLKAEGSRLL
ncbi:MAG TPA: mannose-1-phosphate guanylyltransferase [Anaerolineae bacterium]|jgi:mannose-1-phosphate guanylyltransferase